MPRLYMAVVVDVDDEQSTRRAIVATTQEGLEATAKSYGMKIVWQDYYTSIEDMMEDEQENLWLMNGDESE